MIFEEKVVFEIVEKFHFCQKILKKCDFGEKKNTKIFTKIWGHLVKSEILGIR